MHQRSIHPAMRDCNEWGSQLLNGKMQVVCDDRVCTDWLASFFIIGVLDDAFLVSDLHVSRHLV